MQVKKLSGPARQRLLAGIVAAAIVPAAHAGAPVPATGSLTVAFGAESTTLDPVKISAGVDHYFVGQIFEMLVRRNAALKDENWLAQSWKLDTGKDGKPVLDVQLRKGVRFHNGDPLTSEDMEFSWQRQRDPKGSFFSHYVSSVERFEIVDAHRFRLHFKEPDAQFIVGNMQLWAMPKKYIQKVGEEEFARKPVGTGPWKFVSRTVKDELKLEAFDGYWNKDKRPGIKELTIKVIPEDLTRVAAFKTGKVDFIDNVPPSMVEEFRKMPGVKTVTLVSGNNLFLNFNTQMPKSPFNDVRVRQAAAHAIDVDAIIKRVLFGQGERYAQVGKGSNGYDAALKPYAFDQKRARELLRQAGYPNGFDTPCYNLTTPREPGVKEVGEAMYAYLSAVGIRCQVRNLEYGAWISLGKRGRSGPPEMDGVLSWMWSQGLPGDPGLAWSGHLHSYQAGGGWGTYSYTTDPEVDALLEKQRQTMDPAARTALLQQIARLKQERVLGGLPTYRPLVTFAWRDNKIDYVPWPIRDYWRSFQEVSWKP
ncbi:MAG: ABC transporter substrate-binding protein, partial [Cupriavidus sp.]|nr:ABC transporter substrate-binding protein [Cupriavidus sp.]